MKSKVLVVLVLAVIAVMLAALPALAHHWTNNRMDPVTTGAAFGGYWEWHSYTNTPPPNNEDGGYHFWGYLADTICNDGDAPYSKVTINDQAGDPVSLYGTTCVAGSVANTFQDSCAGSGAGYATCLFKPHPSVVRIASVDFQACRDRSFPYGDNCSPAVQARRS